MPPRRCLHVLIQMEGRWDWDYVTWVQVWDSILSGTSLSETSCLINIILSIGYEGHRANWWWNLCVQFLLYRFGAADKAEGFLDTFLSNISFETVNVLTRVTLSATPLLMTTWTDILMHMIGWSNTTSPSRMMMRLFHSSHPNCRKSRNMINFFNLSGLLKLVILSHVPMMTTMDFCAADTHKYPDHR